MPLLQFRKFIFLEYFIIEPGKVWEELFNILRLKAREGVEVKLIYDDFGCVDRFEDKKFFKKLEFQTASPTILTPVSFQWPYFLTWFAYSSPQDQLTIRLLLEIFI